MLFFYMSHAEFSTCQAAATERLQRNR